MTWTDEATFAVGDTVHASDWNTYIRDDVSSLRHFNDYGCAVYTSIDVNTTTSVGNNLPWDIPLWNVGSMFSAGSPRRFTAAIEGYYEIKLMGCWTNNIAGRRRQWYTLNGGSDEYEMGSVQAVTDVGQRTVVSGAREHHLSASDYISPYFLQASGGSLNLQGGPTFTQASMRLVATP